MSPDELNQIIDKRMHRVAMSLDGDARWKIVSLSRGLPAYVHALGRDAALQAIRNRRLVVREEDVDCAIKELVFQSEQSTRDSYNTAVHSNKKNNLYRQVLLACAICQTDDEGKFTPSDVIEPLSRLLDRRVEIANFQNHLNAFCEIDRGPILEKLGSQRAYRYRFREPKMQPFVIMRGMSEGTISENALSILSAPEQPRFSSEF
jgi:hypothetical protein